MNKKRLKKKFVNHILKNGKKQKCEKIFKNNFKSIQRLKKKFVNHILKNGKKQKCEKILKNNFKSIQKSQKKSHQEILKLTVLNSVPTFRIITLKRRKSILEIPAFLSSYKSRTSWGLKFLVKTSNYQTGNIFYKQLEKEILSNAVNTSSAVELKNEVQQNALKKKKYFKYYKW